MKTQLIFIMLILVNTGMFAQGLIMTPNTKMTIESGTHLNLSVDHNLVLQSDATGDASLLQQGTINFAGSGTAIIKRYIEFWSTSTDGWHLLSSPVASQSIQPNFVPNPPTENEDFYSWDEAKDIWINSKSSPDTWNIDFEDDFVVGKGYLVAYGASKSVSHQFSGVPNTADVVYTDLSYTDASTHTGWHLLGNPYPCNLNWNTTNWNLSGCNATAKIWKESTAAYIDIYAGSTDIIPAMQGFMVCMTGSTNTITIDASDRTHSSQNWYKSAEVNNIKLTAYDTEGSTAQESIIRFNENATLGFDTEYDSRFLSGYAPLFYSVINNGILSTNTLPEITAQTTIPMSFIKNGSSAFYIEAEGVNNLTPQETVYLTDLKTNHTQLLNDNPVYSFTSDEGDIAERFVIHFSPLGIDDLTPSNELNIFAANGKVELRNNKPIDATVNIYNIAGQLLRSTQIRNESSASVKINNYKGPAIVSVITSNQVINKKVIIW